MVKSICEVPEKAYLCGFLLFFEETENPCVASSILAGTTIGKVPKTAQPCGNRHFFYVSF